MAHILVAEDDEQLRLFLVRGLQRAGHSVDDVPDGTAALAQSRKAGYDLLLADIVMPGIDGIELARQVAEEHPGIKIMLITGFAAVAMREEMLGPNPPKLLA